MFRQLFAQANRRFQILPVLQVGLQIGKLQLAFAHQITDTVQRHAAIVADNASAAVAIRQPGQYARFTTAQHIRRIGIEHPLIVRFTQVGKQIFKVRIHFTTVGLERTFDHVDTAERMQRALQRLLRLQSNDLFQFLFNIAGIMRGNRSGNIRIEIDRGVGRIFNMYSRHHFLPQCGGCRRGLGKKGFVPFIRRIVVLNKITDINFCLPVRPFKTLPRFGIQHIAGIDIYLHEK